MDTFENVCCNKRNVKLNYLLHNVSHRLVYYFSYDIYYSSHKRRNRNGNRKHFNWWRRNRRHTDIRIRKFPLP